MSKIVYVDKEECTGCGLCVDELPAVFKMDHEDLAVVSDPLGASEEEIEETMGNCPASCIHWK